MKTSQISGLFFLAVAAVLCHSPAESKCSKEVKSFEVSGTRSAPVHLIVSLSDRICSVMMPAVRIMFPDIPKPHIQRFCGRLARRATMFGRVVFFYQPGHGRVYWHLTLRQFFLADVTSDMRRFMQFVNVCQKDAGLRNDPFLVFDTKGANPEIRECLTESLEDQLRKLGWSDLAFFSPRPSFIKAKAFDPKEVGVTKKGHYRVVSCGPFGNCDAEKFGGQNTKDVCLVKKGL